MSLVPYQTRATHFGQTDVPDVPDYGLLNDLVWSDPSDTALDWEDNERGVSFCYGKSVINAFLATHVSDQVPYDVVKLSFTYDRR